MSSLKNAATFQDFGMKVKDITKEYQYIVHTDYCQLHTTSVMQLSMQDLLIVEQDQHIPHV